jgi:hypothetical protein
MNGTNAEAFDPNLSIEWPEGAIELAAQANDVNLSGIHRARSVYRLFEEFIRPGRHLKDVLWLIGIPSWLKPENVDVWTVVTGKCFVPFLSDATMFSLGVLPEVDLQFSHIDINIRPCLSVDAFRRLLFDLTDSNRLSSNHTIASFGWTIRASHPRDYNTKYFV